MRLLPRRIRKAVRAPVQAPSPGPTTPERFETTAIGEDGVESRIVATTVQDNRPSNENPPIGHREKEPEPQADLSISKGREHAANQRSRPISWAIVAFICCAFIAAGIGLIETAWWVFYGGLVAVVVGGVAGWIAGIMDDRGEPGAGESEAEAS